MEYSGSHDISVLVDTIRNVVNLLIVFWRPNMDGHVSPVCPLMVGHDLSRATTAGG